MEIKAVKVFRARRTLKRNNSAPVGVGRHVQTDVRVAIERNTYAFWVAPWTDENGKRRAKTFSASQYGEDDAFQMAIKSRQKGVAERKKNT